MASILVAVAMFVLLFQDEKKKKGVGKEEIMKIDSSITERLPGGSKVIGCTV